MQRLICICLFLCMVSPAHAQWKRIDKSAKKKPAWVGGLEADFWIASGSGSSLDAAKNAAFLQIKVQLAEALVTYVQATTSVEIKEQLDAAGRVFSEDFVSNSQTSTGNPQAISGIASNKDISFYWETYRDRKRDTVYYSYHLRYPMSRAELNQLLADWKKRDDANTERLNVLDEQRNTFTELSALTSALTELSALEKLFFDDRKQQAVVLRTNYQNLINQLRSTVVYGDSGRYFHQLWHNNRPVYSDIPLQFKSSCAQFKMLGENAGRQQFLVFNNHCELETERTVSYRIPLAGRLPLQGQFILQPNKNSLQFLQWRLTNDINAELEIELMVANEAVVQLAKLEMTLGKERLVVSLADVINSPGRRIIKAKLNPDQKEKIKRLAGKAVPAQLEFIQVDNQQIEQIKWVKIITAP